MMLRAFLQWFETAPPMARADAVHSLATSYLHVELDEETRSGIEAVMTLVLDDPTVEVRFALADALATSSDAPRHVILSLAVDRPEIAAAVVARSPLFIDAELVDLVAADIPVLQLAVASRPRVSIAVAAAIAEVGGREPCRRLFHNPGATIARISLKRMAERFGDEPAMRDMMLARPDLPAQIRQMLIRRLSEALGSMVVVQSWVGEDRAKEMTQEACDRATVALAAETEQNELPALVEHLRVTEQLTTALLLRAVCAGNIAFFEAALAVLSHMPEARVASLVRAGRNTALRAIYAKAGLPPVAFDAFTAALDTWRRVAASGGPRDRYRFVREVVEAVLARYQDITDGEMNELAMMLRRFAADQAREAARDYAATLTAA